MTISPPVGSTLVECGSFHIETALRRELKGFLSNIKEMLDHSPNSDDLSSLIRRWHEDFSFALRTNDDLMSIKERFITLLKGIMVDPLTMTPLDEQALIGSDGRTYGYQTLSLRQISVSEEFRSHSPFDRNTTEEFTVEPHDLVRYLIGWLKNHDTYTQNEAIQQEFLKISGKDSKLLLPTKKNNRIRRIKSVQKERMRSMQRGSEQLEMVREATAEQINQTFQPLHNRVSKFQQDTTQKLNNFEVQSEEYTERLQDRITQCKEEVEEFERDISLIQSKIIDVDVQLSSAKQIDLQIQQRMTELEKTIKERDQGMWMSIACIVAAVAVTWMIGPSGFTLVSHTKASSTGASIVYTIAL